MERLFKTILMAVIAIAALVWACSYKFSGLAWFPGFMVAVWAGIKIMDINGVGKEKKNARKCGPGC